MNLILKGRGVELNERLREYATEKFTKVQRFFERILKMEIEFSEERNPRVKDPHKVDVTVKTPGETLRAHGAGGDYFAAIDQAADRLETQVKKHKERLNDRSHRGESIRIGTEPQLFETDAGPPIFTSSMQLVKPITPEEAVMELEDRGLQFMLFTNAETMGAGVVYRRGDGSYGLIEHQN